MDMAQLLPDDVLANVLRHLGLRGLAASRRVCKAWRAVIDARRLREDLLPLSLAGIFTAPGYTYDGRPVLPEYFSRPSSSKIAAKFDYLDTQHIDCLMIAQHCNGLLLLDGPPSVGGGLPWAELRVLNPATRHWALLPPPPPLRTPGMEAEDYGENNDDVYLVFDPTVSPHYEVFLINSVPHMTWDEFDNVLAPATKALEWPPSPYVLRVFSSRTRRWEERPFIRDGEAAGTIGYMKWVVPPMHYYAAYRRGALYVHQHDFVMRITLSNDKYQVIKLPIVIDVRADPEHYIGKSEKGVYCALLYGVDGFGLRVWFLDESCGQMEWVLKRDINLEPLLTKFPWKHSDRPWIVQYANYDEDDKSEPPAGGEFEWDSDNDNVVVTEDRSVETYHEYVTSLLGFHPNRVIVFFLASFKRVVAYHFNSSKIEDLGCLRCAGIYLSFLYTPCRTGELSDNK